MYEQLEKTFSRPFFKMCKTFDFSQRANILSKKPLPFLPNIDFLSNKIRHNNTYLAIGQCGRQWRANGALELF